MRITSRLFPVKDLKGSRHKDPEVGRDVQGKESSPQRTLYLYHVSTL